MGEVPLYTNHILSSNLGSTGVPCPQETSPPMTLQQLLSGCQAASQRHAVGLERVFFIYNLLVRILFIIVMIKWTGLAPRGFEFPFLGSLTSTFLGQQAYIALRWS